MEDSQYDFPQQLILARQANLLRSFYRFVAALTTVALLLIALLPGFATAEDVLEPFVRNVVVLMILGILYLMVEKNLVLEAIFATIGACGLLACYTIYMESPGNMQMMALIIFPTCMAGFLPNRQHFWLVYVLNFFLLLFTFWLLLSVKGIALEYRSLVTLGMLQALLALLVDTISSSYRESIRTTFEQLKAIQAAEAMVERLDNDLVAAVSQKQHAEHVSSQLETTGRLALEVAGAAAVQVNLTTGMVAISDDFFHHSGLSEPPRTLTDLYDCIEPADLPALKQIFSRSTESSVGERLEGDFAIRVSPPAYWMLMLEPATETAGELQMHGIVVDVTSRVLAQQKQTAENTRLRESQRLESLGMLAGAIAHDFNNLLHVIMLNADLARQSLPEDSKPATSLKRLMTTVERAAELCSELLAYSGRGQFTVEPFEVNQLVEEMRNLLLVSTPKGVDISIESDGTLPVVEGDITQIRQVVMNLITNAGEAIDNDGSIRIHISTKTFDENHFSQVKYIEAAMPGRYAEILVTDNGCGMDEDVRRQIFDPFYSRKEGGHGLGLSAVLGIVRGHHGAISVTSSPGEGTTFSLLLPIANAGLTAAATFEDTANDIINRGTVLFADDEAEIRQLAKVVLEEQGYNIIEARDGQEAIDLFREKHEELQLVILDLIMPNISGIEAHAEISAIDSSVPVVFSSGFNENEALDELPEQTRLGFLKKPDLAEELRQFVRRLSDSR